MNNSITLTLITLIAITSLLINACTRSITNKEIETRSKTREINIPSACLDNNGLFTPIKSITTKLRYNDKATQYNPIRNEKGFIAYDFNNDKKSDYIFIEKSQKSIKLTTCMSRASNYLRRQTPFVIHEEKQIDFQTISESIKLQTVS